MPRTGSIHILSLKKYDGKYSYKIEDKLFSLTIFIPIRQ